MQLWLGSCSPNISISPYVVEQGGMLDTVLEHVVTVTMDEEGEEMEQLEVSHPSDVFRVRAAAGPAQHSS